MEIFEKSKHDIDFYKKLSELEYNSHANNIGIYYVINSNGKGTVYVLSDPFELLEKESIMDKYEAILDENVMALETVRLIH